MYTLEYRYKRTNKRWSHWFAESRHENQFEAVQALGRHVSKFETFSVRVVRYKRDSLMYQPEPVQIVAEYKFK